MEDGYIVYFDIIRDYQPAWQAWIYVSALLGFFLFLAFLPDTSPGVRAIACVGAVFSAVALGVVGYNSYQAKFVWPKLVEEHQAIVIEGLVSDIRLSPQKLNIAFSVGGIRFKHFGRTDSEAYNLARDPRRIALAGKCARIEMTENHDILWFGVGPEQLCVSGTGPNRENAKTL